MQRDNWLGLTRLWLGFSVRVYGQDLGSCFGFRSWGFRVRFSV